MKVSCSFFVFSHKLFDVKFYFYLLVNEIIYVKGNNKIPPNSLFADDCEKQISTLAGNQSPSYYVGEVLFTMGIIGLGLLLFALLIGNMQNFLQGLGRR